MDYLPIPNLLLEALAYLGRRAGGHTGSYMVRRMVQRGVQDLEPFQTLYAPIGRLTELLDRQVDLPPEALERLFANLPGFTLSTIGTYSPVFLLLYPVLDRYDGQLPALLDYVCQLPPDHAARHLLLSLGFYDGGEGQEAGAVEKLMNCILSLDIPQESKLALTALFYRRESFLREAEAPLSAVLQVLEAHREELEAPARSLGQEIGSMGLEAYLGLTSSLSLTPGTDYRVRPFLFGMDTNLSLEPAARPAGRETLLYAGFMRRCLLESLSRPEDEAAAVYEAVKLLGDRTRFDILCCLRDRPAYGQELSNRFGLARNTIHHHISKLSNAGLITNTVEGNRVYYAVDREAAASLLARLRRLLLGDGRGADPLP